MELLPGLGAAFFLGLLTPLGAVCVLPLYPAFLVYLSHQAEGREGAADRRTIAALGLVMGAGTLAFMLLLGLIFTTILEVSLTNVIGIASPVAFGVLVVISVLLIFDFDVGRFLPRVRAPFARNPWRGAFVYGVFFGAIVVPCNPLFIAALFARTVTALDFAVNMLDFLFFGIGMASPLLAFSILSGAASERVMHFLTKSRRTINLAAGVIMLTISLYYLVVVFRIVPILGG
ncbi:MAG: cytochrome C biogenesis protein [Chloroflexi bacterium]|nr:cytochrome C biogenesis protein [Chloroflexota bacterium]